MDHVKSDWICPKVCRLFEQYRFRGVLVHPIIYLNEYWSVATQVGIDYVDNGIEGIQGSLTKVSAALQLTPSRKYLSRPVLRLYATYAQWGDELVGSVGNKPGDAPYGLDDNGWTIGAQIEHIW